MKHNFFPQIRVKADTDKQINYDDFDDGLNLQASQYDQYVDQFDEDIDLEYVGYVIGEGVPDDLLQPIYLFPDGQPDTQDQVQVEDLINSQNN